MRPYTIRQVSVVLEYQGGHLDKYESGILPDDTRTVLVGLDALGAAGTFEPLPRPRIVTNPEQPAAAARSGKDDNSLYGTEQEAKATPDYCEYRNGKWYCWSDAL